MSNALGVRRSPRQVVRWIAAGALLFGQLTIARATAAADDVRTRYTGTFHFVGGEHERAALDQALESALKSASWILRPFIRPRLRDRTRIAPWFILTFPRGWISTKVPGYAPARSPDSGAEVDYLLDGETIRMSQKFEGERLVQRFRAREGTRVNEYVPADQNKTLLLHVTVQSSRLSKPLRYTLTYRR